jgi:hypothetical protein
MLQARGSVGQMLAGSTILYGPPRLSGKAVGGRERRRKNPAPVVAHARTKKGGSKAAFCTERTTHSSTRSTPYEEVLHAIEFFL